MNYVLATLASIGVVLLFLEVLASYMAAKKIAQMIDQNKKLSWHVNYWRVALTLILEVGVYITWLTNRLLG